jgi:ferredoxin
MAMLIDADLCTACGECSTVCPTDAISPKKGVFWIDPEICNECENDGGEPQCMATCPDDCIDYDA